MYNTDDLGLAATLRRLVEHLGGDAPTTDNLQRAMSRQLREHLPHLPAESVEVMAAGHARAFAADTALLAALAAAQRG